MTWRSHTGILIFVNKTPIPFHSKHQNTFETSTFGSKLVAVQSAMEMIVGLHHKLQMFSAPIEGPADVHCNDQGVAKNTLPLESTLSKKHIAVNHHTAHKACPADTMRVAEQPTMTDLADVFMKPLSRLHRERLLGMVGRTEAEAPQGWCCIPGFLSRQGSGCLLDWCDASRTLNLDPGVGCFGIKCCTIHAWTFPNRADRFHPHNVTCTSSASFVGTGF